MSPAVDLSEAITHNEANARKLCANRADDLISAGNEAIGLALSRFDPSRGYKFLTYAHAYIEKAQRLAFKNVSTPVQLPVNREVALETLDVDEQRDIPAPEVTAEHLEAFDEVKFLMAGLSRRDRSLIVMYFFEDMTLKQIAARKNLSLATVSVRLNQALGRMRTKSKESGL